MNIALIGYGKMGHAVEEEAIKRGHTIVCTADCHDEVERHKSQLQSADVAIEFSQPTAATDNLIECLATGVAVVCGTTGWYSQYETVVEHCRNCGGRMLTATNFSIGMNIMFALNERLASLMSGRADYATSIIETHHIHKIDAPSGTALSLQSQIVEYGKREVAAVPITSRRIGEVPGIHTVTYTSPQDTITLTHEAHSRQGLAIGAVVAAEWLVQAKPGVYTMKDVLS